MSFEMYTDERLRSTISLERQSNLSLSGLSVYQNSEYPPVFLKESSKLLFMKQLICPREVPIPEMCMGKCIDNYCKLFQRPNRV